MSIARITSRYYLLFIVALLYSSSIYAQHGWDFNVADYANSGDITAVVKLDGVEVSEGAIGAFVGDECRGFSENTIYFGPADTYLFQFLVYSNESSGEEMKFRYYDPEADEVLDITESVTFKTDMILGNAYDPIEFNVFFNNPPVVSKSINDINIDEYFISLDIELDTVFFDADGDQLSFDASNNNSGVVGVSLSGSLLTISEQGTGYAEIIVSADDGAVSVRDTFNITVGDINVSPVIESEIQNQFQIEGFSLWEEDLSIYFSDPDNDQLSFSAESSDNSVASVSVEGSVLSLQELSPGVSTISVSARDGEFTATFDFTFTINGNPFVKTSLPDMAYNEGFSSDIIDLKNVFGDPENEVLTLSLESISADILSATLNNDELVISEKSTGTADLVLAASDGNAVTTHTFTVVINGRPVNRASLPDLELEKGFSDDTIMLNDFFYDPEGTDLLYSAESIPRGIVGIEIVNDTLFIKESSNGITTLTISASDGQLEVVDDFQITLNAEPVIDAFIDDVVLEQGFELFTFNISDYFSDPDGDELIFTATNSANDVTTISIINDSLYFFEVGIGNSDVVITADDGIQSVSQTFSLSVNSLNSPPILLSSIPDAELVENIDSLRINLSSFFTDPEGGLLSYQVTYHDSLVLEPRLTDSLLVLSPLSAGVSDVVIAAMDNAGISTTDTITIQVLKENPLTVKLENGKQIRSQDTISICNELGSIEINIQTENSWDVNGTDISWMILETDEDSTLNLTFSENETGEDRYAAILIYDSQKHIVKYVIQQLALCETGFDKSHYKNDFKVYPNPTNGILYLSDIKGFIADELTIQVFSPDGRNVLSRQVLDYSSKSIRIKINHLNPGVYYISLISDKQKLTRRILKY